MPDTQTGHLPDIKFGSQVYEWFKHEKSVCLLEINWYQSVHCLASLVSILSLTSLLVSLALLMLLMSITEVSLMHWYCTCQALARSLFWVSRRDRELSSFSLVPRDENEILYTESRASRRDREFCSQNLGPWDEIENFVPQISKFETRLRFFDHFTKTYF